MVLVFTCGINSLIGVTSAPIGVYLLLIGTPVFLLEFGPAITTVCGNNGCCCRTFGFVLGFDKKRRGVLYILMAVPLFLGFWSNNYSIVAGVLLTFCGLLYFVKGWEQRVVKMQTGLGPADATQPVRNASPPLPPAVDVPVNPLAPV
ncbi:unnamed protein product, partial [Mesorhabditis spiculigera]